jgi:hypothetical protein
MNPEQRDLTAGRGERSRRARVIELREAPTFWVTAHTISRTCERSTARSSRTCTTGQGCADRRHRQGPTSPSVHRAASASRWIMSPRGRPRLSPNPWGQNGAKPVDRVLQRVRMAGYSPLRPVETHWRKPELRLKSGRSPVRSRPWSPALAQIRDDVETPTGLASLGDGVLMWPNDPLSRRQMGIGPTQKLRSQIGWPLRA